MLITVALNEEADMTEGLCLIEESSLQQQQQLRRTTVAEIIRGDSDSISVHKILFPTIVYSGSI